MIVHSDADLDLAAQRIAFGGYYQAGQSCISVQRVLVASEVYDDFAARLTKQVEQLKVGDPMDETVDVGPVIDAQRGRPHRRVGRRGARRRAPRCSRAARPTGRSSQPTLLSQTTPEMKVRCEEVFGPVCTITPYQTFEEALAEVNDSKYGLQAGVFTNDINRAFEAHRTLEVGGVIVNDVSAFRADQMPYGGSKESGLRPRGPAVRDGGDDRAAHHGALARAAVGRGERCASSGTRPWLLVAVFGVVVVRRLVRSWRDAYGGRGRSSTAGHARRRDDQG